MRGRSARNYVAVLVMASWLLAGCVAQPVDSPTPTPEPPIRLSLDDAVQQAVDQMACHEVSGSPTVLLARRVRHTDLSNLEMQDAGGPGEERPLAVIVLGGDFNLIGLAPGFSGWTSRVAFIHDLRYVHYSGLRSYAADRVFEDASPEERPIVHPSYQCQHLPNPSRSPRLSQNCFTRQFGLVPRVCGRSMGDLAQVEVELIDNAFVPAEVRVSGRTEVVWTNHGSAYHTILGTGWVNPVEMNPGDDWTVSYDAFPHTFEYYCTIHPQEMRMRLIMTPPGRVGGDDINRDLLRRVSE